MNGMEQKQQGHHCDGHGEQPGRGAEGGVAEDGLEELHERQEQGEHDGEYDEQVDRSGGQPTVGEQADVEERMIAANLDEDERDAAGDAGDEPDDRDRVGPALFGAFVERKDDSTDGDDRQQRAGDVEPGFDVFTGVRHDNEGAGEGDHGDGDREREHPRPS